MAEGFEPVVGEDPRVLVLGTVPSVKSLELRQYYGNPCNVFWRLMLELLGAGSGVDYDKRVQLLKQSRIALWDVLASAERPGSLDARIVRSSEIPNDIAAFLRRHPSITHVFLNGSKAVELFERHCGPKFQGSGVSVVRLPSTSPANASQSCQAKLEVWRQVVDAARGYPLAPVRTSRSIYGHATNP
jgi:hypoxanthine-DNA glycosylase